MTQPPAGLLTATAPESKVGVNEDHEAEGHASSDHFRFTTSRTWAYRDFLTGADADILGLEFNSAWGWGNYDVSNISYFEVASYPRPIPGKPAETPADPSNTEAADGTRTS